MSKLMSDNRYPWIVRLLALLLLGIIVGYLIAERSLSSSQLPAELCMTSGCVSAANVILQSLNRSVDPCEDFYGYTCGNYKNSKLIPMDTDSWHPLLWETRFQDYFLSVLRSKAESDKVLSQASLFYDACTKYTGKNELIEDQIIYDVVKHIGHYPELGINSRKFDLTDAFISMNGLDFFVFLKLDVIREPVYRFNGSVAPVLNFFAPFKTKYNRKHFIKHHKTIVAEVMNVFNLTTSNLDMPTVDKITESLLQFYETSIQRLVKIMKGSQLQNFTIGEAQKAIPMVNITRFFMGQSHPNSSLKISDNTLIPSLISLNNLGKLNQILEAAGPDVLRHVLLDVMWSYIGQKTIHPIQCYKQLQSYFVAPVSGLFGALLTKPEEKAVIQEMANDVLEASVEVLQESDWMDEKTKEFAIDKARKISQCIAYPDEWLDPKNRAKGFEYLNLTKADTFVEMKRKLNLMKTHIAYQFVFHPVDRSMLCSTIKTTAVNAYYYGLWNSIVILSRIAQEPLFDYLFPKIYFYSTIGAVVGHEVMHGFDSKGRNMGSDGEKKDWWSKSSREEYDKRQKCFIDQYNNMSSNGVRENGRISIRENIADNAGLSVAIRAIKRLIDRNPEHRIVLPGLHEFTPEQTFFLSFGQLWCGTTTKLSLSIAAISDPHAFHRSRINGPVTNHKEFAEAFQCKPGSKHNPKDEDRCILW